MLKIKKLIVPGLSLMMLVEPTSYAGTMGDLEKSAFSVGLTALYFQAYSDFFPVNSGGNGSSFDLVTYNQTDTSFKAPWDWSGIIDGSYYFSDRTDLNVNWMYYSVGYNGLTQTTNVPDPQYGEPTQLSNTFNSGKMKINSVNAEYGESFDISPKGTVRLFGGLQYLNIKNNFQKYSASSSISASSISSDTSRASTNNKYQGIGPRVGLNANHKLKGNFSVFANSAAAILLARHTQNSNSNFSSSSTSSSYSESTARHDLAIPELEARLGVAFNKPMTNGMISLSAGWSVIHYFNVNNNGNPVNSRNDGPSLTLSGPFVQGKWVV